MPNQDTPLREQFENVTEKFDFAVYDFVEVDNDWTDREATIAVPDYEKMQVHSYDVPEGVPKLYVTFQTTVEDMDDLRADGIIAFPKHDRRSQTKMQPGKCIVMWEEDAPEDALELVSEVGGVAK